VGSRMTNEDWYELITRAAAYTIGVGSMIALAVWAWVVV